MKKILYILLGAVMLTSCYKSKFTNTDNPDKGTITLNVQWNNLHIGDVAPSEYTLYVGEDKHTITDPTKTLVLEPKESQEILVYTNSMGISVTNGIATLSEATSAVQDPNPNPQSLYYACDTIRIVADQQYAVQISTLRGTAPLTLKLSYEQSEVANIKSVTVELSGIATSRNLRTDALTDKGTLIQYPILEANASELILNYNILGTIGEEQKLKLTFTTADNQTKVVTADLTARLAGFNKAMNALTLTGDMNLPTDLEVEGNITDWVVVNGGNGTAN